MMHQAVDGSNGHHGVSKDGIPLAEGLMSGDKQTAPLVAMSNEFKEYRGFGLRLFDVAQIINRCSYPI